MYRIPNDKHVNLNTILFLYELVLHFLLRPRYVDKADLHSVFWHTETLHCSEGRDNNAHYLHGQGWTDSMTLSVHFSRGTTRGFAGVVTLKTALKNIANKTA